MIIVSACLCGDNCRYNGKDNYNEKVIKFLSDKKFIKVCPEVIGGLETPRAPCEIRNGRVISSQGEDLTHEFEVGAKCVLEIALENKCILAILKEGSPSCGVNYIYDGSFTNNLVKGMGFTASLLKNNGFKISSEKELEWIINLKD